MVLDGRLLREDHDWVGRLHDSDWQGVWIGAGGGSRAIPRLLSRPGASRTVLEVLVPYGSGALYDLALGTGGSSVDRETVCAMAERAFDRANRLSDGRGRYFGIGVTAALATDRNRRGIDRAWLGVRTVGRMILAHVVFSPPAETRDGQEDVMTEVVFDLLSKALRLDRGQCTALPGVTVIVTEEKYKVGLHGFLDGGWPWVMIHTDGRVVAEGKPPPVLLPGSYDPIHGGHTRMLALAADYFHEMAALELSVANVDKPEIDRVKIKERLRFIGGRHPVVLTRAATFVEKARLFPGTKFVLGMDTMVRLIDPSYYGGQQGICEALETFEASDCRFLVVGREDVSGWTTLDQISLPTQLKPRVEMIPRNIFEARDSSTAIRTRQSERSAAP